MTGQEADRWERLRDLLRWPSWTPGEAAFILSGLSPEDTQWSEREGWWVSPLPGWPDYGDDFTNSQNIEATLNRVRPVTAAVGVAAWPPQRWIQWADESGIPVPWLDRTRQCPSLFHLVAGPAEPSPPMEKEPSAPMDKPGWRGRGQPTDAAKRIVEAHLEELGNYERLADFIEHMEDILQKHGFSDKKGADKKLPVAKTIRRWVATYEAGNQST